MLFALVFSSNDCLHFKRMYIFFKRYLLDALQLFHLLLICIIFNPVLVPRLNKLFLPSIFFHYMYVNCLKCIKHTHTCHSLKRQMPSISELVTGEECKAAPFRNLLSFERNPCHRGKDSELTEKSLLENPAWNCAQVLCSLSVLKK